jgi:hypothetical protein
MSSPPRPRPPASQPTPSPSSDSPPPYSASPPSYENARLTAPPAPSLSYVRMALSRLSSATLSLLDLLS